MSNPVKLAAYTFAAFAFASAFVLSARAQAGRPGSPSPGRSGMGEVLRREMHREMVLKEMEEGGKRTAPARDDRRRLFAQTAEDFKSIQLINKELMRAATRAGELDLKLVAKSASEIKKRAQRLKVNLALPEPEKPEQQRPRPEDAPREGEQLKPTLHALDKVIARFAYNPVFKQGVLDAQHSAKARRDLEEIIETAARVTRHSERLDKAARKSQ